MFILVAWNDIYIAPYCSLHGSGRVV